MKLLRNLIFSAITVILAGLSGCQTGRVPPLPPDAVPPRVAVASFDNRSSFEGQWNLGAGMADLLVSELVDSRNFVVLERGSLDKVVDEISRQSNRLFRPEGRVDEGRLDNAHYLIRGVITDFTQSSGGSFWLGLRHLFIGSGGYTARVGLTLTIVDIESGRIVDSVQCAGKARAGDAFAKGDYKGIQFGGRSFFQTPLGIATASAIRQGLHGVVKKMPRITWMPMIAEVDGPRIVLNGGRERGLEAGVVYQVRGKGTPVTDPLTGDVLDIMPGPIIGTVRIMEMRDQVSVAELVSGHGIARGQTLERPLALTP